MLEPNPWFSKHVSASEERDGYIRKLSNLGGGKELIQKLAIAEEDERKLPIFLQKAETLVDDSRKVLTECSLIETDFDKLPMLISSHVESGEVLSTLALDQLHSIKEKFRKLSLGDRKDARGDCVADEDWKLIRHDDSDKSDE